MFGIKMAKAIELYDVYPLFTSFNFYARKKLLLSARLSHRNSVRPSVCPSVYPSVCHTGGSVKNGILRFLANKSLYLSNGAR